MSSLLAYKAKVTVPNILVLGEQTLKVVIKKLNSEIQRQSLKQSYSHKFKETFGDLEIKTFDETFGDLEIKTFGHWKIKTKFSISTITVNRD